MFTLARQRPRALIGLVGTALFLTGCAGSGTTTTETVTVTEATPSEDSSQAETAQDSASLAAPATFDRNDPNFEFFNICEELTNEDLADFGVEFLDEPLVQLDVPSSVCSFTDIGGFEESKGIQFADVSMGGLTEQELLSRVTVIHTSATEKSQIPGTVFFVQSDLDNGKSCEVSAPTHVGRLWVGYGTVRSGVMTQDEICEQAYSYFENFYQKIEAQA